MRDLMLLGIAVAVLILSLATREVPRAKALAAAPQTVLAAQIGPVGFRLTIAG